MDDPIAREMTDICEIPLKERSPSQYVKLNVGGTKYCTTIGTLTKTDNMFRAMFSGSMEVFTDSEDWVLIDRCGKHFGTILNYLRDGTVALPDSYREIMELLAETKYFLIKELTESCEQALAQKEENKMIEKKKEEKKKQIKGISSMYIITTQAEHDLIVKSTSMLVIKLRLHSSYTNYIEKAKINILENFKLFDKLALEFSGKILFIKRIGPATCVCWEFYSQGKLVNTVTCSMVECPEYNNAQCNNANNALSTTVQQYTQGDVGAAPLLQCIGMFAAARIDCFHSTMRKRAVSLVSRLRASSNIVMAMIAARVDCPYTRHCCERHLYSNTISF